LKRIFIQSSLFQVLFFLIISVVIGFGSNWLKDDPIPLFALKLKIATPDDLLSDIVTESVLRAIGLDQAQEFYNEDVVFVDARDLEYYEKGHIPGAWNSNDFMELIFRLDSLQGKDRSLVTYCDGDDCGSSEDLAYDLQNEGFTKIFVFVGGWSEWQQAGYSVEK